MKNTLLTLFLFAFTTLYSQSSNEYKKLTELILKNPTSSAYKKMPIIIAKFGKEETAKQFLKVDYEYKRMSLVELEGKNHFPKCASILKRGREIENQIKENDGYLKKRKKMIEAASSKTEHSYHKGTYNWMVSDIKSNIKALDELKEELDLCFITEKNRNKSLVSEHRALQNQLFQLYENNKNNVEFNVDNIAILKKLTGVDNPYSLTKLDLSRKKNNYIARKYWAVN